MIYTDVLCYLEHHFKAYTTIKNKTFYRELIFSCFPRFTAATITHPLGYKRRR